MGLPWIDLHLWPVPSALLLIGAWLAAAVVYRTAPHRSVNRALARVLLLEGLVMGFSAGWPQMVESRALSYAMATIGTAAVAAVPYQYLAFLGAAIDSPAVAPFRSTRVRWVLNVLSVVAAAFTLLRPSLFITDMYPIDWGTWNFQYRPGGLMLVRLQALGALYGILSALWAYARTNAGTTARSRAALVASAFGIRDVFIAIVLMFYPVLRPIPFWGDFLYNPAQGFVYIVYVALLAYGLLHSQLFEIELRLKFALTQGAAGALLAGSFFLLSELLEALLPVEGIVPGILAAGLVVIALRPLHGVARRAIDRVMPGVARTPAYLGARRAEIYRAALESAIQDGQVTTAERAILSSLREQLGLPSAEATSLEVEILGPSNFTTA